MARKALPDDQKSEVFGLTVPKAILEAYAKLTKDKKKPIRNTVRQVFETQVLIAVGGQMIASDDRSRDKT
jgi:hypothetical protein